MAAQIPIRVHFVTLKEAFLSEMLKAFIENRSYAEKLREKFGRQIRAETFIEIMNILFKNIAKEVAMKNVGKVMIKSGVIYCQNDEDFIEMLKEIANLFLLNFVYRRGHAIVTFHTEKENQMKGNITIGERVTFNTKWQIELTDFRLTEVKQDDFCIEIDDWDMPDFGQNISLGDSLDINKISGKNLFFIPRLIIMNS